jgi:hypothetical protein
MPCDFDARAAELTDLGDGQVDEVRPIRRPVDEPEPAPCAAHAPVIELATADVSEKVMDLVNGQDRGGREPPNQFSA